MVDKAGLGVILVNSSKSCWLTAVDTDQSEDDQ